MSESVGPGHQPAPGAALLVGWFDSDRVWQTRYFDSTQMDVADGDILTIDLGEIVNHERRQTDEVIENDA